MSFDCRPSGNQTVLDQTAPVIERGSALGSLLFFDLGLYITGWLNIASSPSL